jgi:hypothetical protein
MVAEEVFVNYKFNTEKVKHASILVKMSKRYLISRYLRTLYGAAIRIFGSVEPREIISASQH